MVSTTSGWWRSSGIVVRAAGPGHFRSETGRSGDTSNLRLPPETERQIEFADSGGSTGWSGAKHGWGGRVDKAALEEVVREGSGGGDARAEAKLPLLLLIMDGTGKEWTWSPGSRGAGEG
jgi:hypothetical protein